MWPFSRKNKQAPVSVPVLTTSVSVAAPSPIATPTPPATQVVVPKASTAVAQTPSHAIDVRAEAIKSVIAAEEFFEGNLHFQHGAKIDGRVRGNINFGLKDGLLVLNESGQVEGNIRGPRAIVVGEVFGNIVVEGKLIILPKARIHGDIAAGTLQIMEGSTINGRIHTVSEYDRLKTFEHHSSQAHQQIAQPQTQTAPQQFAPTASQPIAEHENHAHAPEPEAAIIHFAVGNSGR